MGSIGNSPSQHFTKTLSEWISQTDASSIPPQHLERAKYLILDGLACALVGSRLPWSATATHALIDAEPSGACTIIGWQNHTLGPLSAALINSTFIQGFELDDWHSVAPLHSNAILIPALFAAIEGLAHSNKDSESQSQSQAEENNVAPVTGRDFLRAYVVGCEVGPRVGLALHGKDLLTRGWHSGAVQGPSAAAAAVSSLLGLSAQQTEWALGIACTQAGGLMSAQFGSMAKRMQHGFASRNGLLGVILARRDYTGIEAVYETEYGGFLSMFSRDAPVNGKKERYMPQELTRGLGDRWEIENIRVKLHAAMAGLHGTIDCVEELQQKHPERFEVHKLCEIKEIVTEHGEAVYNHGGWIAPEDKPLTSTAAQMSIQYAAAAQLIDREVLMTQYGADKLNRVSVRQLMNKVRPVHNPEFDRDAKRGFQTDLSVTFTDGIELRATAQAPKGVQPPVSNGEIVDKWRRLVSGILDTERRDRIEKAVLNLDNAGPEDLRLLFTLLKGDVQCPIKTD